MSETADKTAVKQLEPYQWKPGQSGNLNGRPKGSISPMDTIRRIFESDPTRYQEFINEYLKDPRNRQHIVEMIDGKPKGSETNVAVQVNNYSQQDREEFESYDKIVELAIKKFGTISEAIKEMDI